ncbi:hypothetical protein EZV62_015595 [Acer yangbiense]|uniref:Large ribosomal subunit protein bL20c n=1 Tax=Acer yangbiense TaxID=1000413 RepID=A0A5C7HN81_9ROSI|nr:hypothetical protein EZV62_015595 [Acer yangbiense]
MNKKEIFKLAKGFRGRAKNCIRIARERVEKALQYSYRDRRNKKRDMRGLWIQRINAGTRQHGVSFFISSIYFFSCFLLYLFFFLVSAIHIYIIVKDLYRVNYGNFMHGLKKENIQLDRKVLSELSMHEPYSFKSLVDISRNAFPGNKNVVHPPRKANISINA